MEVLSLADLRRELEQRGVSSTTPGLRGEQRHAELLRRYRDTCAGHAGPSPSAGQGTHAAPSPSALISGMNMSQLRDELKVHGISTETPGMRGADRQTELARRLRAARQQHASADSGAGVETGQTAHWFHNAAEQPDGQTTADKGALDELARMDEELARMGVGSAAGMFSSRAEPAAEAAAAPAPVARELKPPSTPPTARLARPPHARAGGAKSSSGVVRPAGSGLPVRGPPPPAAAAAATAAVHDHGPRQAVPGRVSLRGLKEQAKAIQLQLGEIKRWRKTAMHEGVAHATASAGADGASAARPMSRRREREVEEAVEARAMQHAEFGIAAEQKALATLEKLEARIVAEQQRRQQLAEERGGKVGARHSAAHHGKPGAAPPPHAHASARRQRVLDSARPTTNADRLGRQALRARADGKVGEAEELYKAAIAQDEFHVANLGNYALFLQQARGDADSAERYFERACDGSAAAVEAAEDSATTAAKPAHISTLALHLMNFAAFLSKMRSDQDRAEELYGQAIKLAPAHAGLLGNFALFLKRVRNDPARAEAFFKRAIVADPHHANNLGNYAGLVKGAGAGRFDEAEMLYKSAVEAVRRWTGSACLDCSSCNTNHRPHIALTTLPPFPRQDPDNASVLSNFANFMFKCRSKPDAAKELYLRALRADTNHKMAARN